MKDTKNSNKVHATVALSDGQWKELYWRIGVVIHLSQMIEYNLPNIFVLSERLSAFGDKEGIFLFEYAEKAESAEKWYEWLRTKPMGAVIAKAKEDGFLKPAVIEELGQILRYRNYAIHRMFKIDLTTEAIEKHYESIIAVHKNFPNAAVCVESDATCFN